MYHLTVVYNLDGRRLPDPTTDPLGAAALLESWRVATADIPLVWLDRVFTLAIQRHTDEFPLRASAVRKAWDDTAAERELEARARALPAPESGVPCPTCTRGVPGWLRWDAPVGDPHFGQIYQCPDCDGTGVIAGPAPTVLPPRPATPDEMRRLQTQILRARPAVAGFQRAGAGAPPPAPPPDFLRAADDPAVRAAVAATLNPQAAGAADVTRLPGPVRPDSENRP